MLPPKVHPTKTSGPAGWSPLEIDQPECFVTMKTTYVSATRSSEMFGSLEVQDKQNHFSSKLFEFVSKTNLFGNIIENSNPDMSQVYFQKFSVGIIVNNED